MNRIGENPTERKQRASRTAPAHQNEKTSRAVPALPRANTALYEKFFAFPRVDFTNPEDVRDRTEAYMKYVHECGIAPLQQDYAYVLGITRQHLHDIRVGKYGGTYPLETRQIIERAHTWLEAALAQTAMVNPSRSIFTIWLEKNCYGYRDSPIEIVPPQQSLAEEESAADVMRRYALASVPELTEDEAASLDFFLKAPESTETEP